MSALLAVACAAVMVQCGAGEGGPAPEQLAHPPFDSVRVYRPSGQIRRLALLVSGDGGWGGGISGIAHDLAGEDTLVAGIDGAEFLRRLARAPAGCASPGADLAELGRFLSARYGLAPGVHTVLVGHSAGATLAYVALVQAPPGTFAGLLTLSFCTELDLTRPLCPAPGLRGTATASGFALRPGGALPAPWVGVHGSHDQVCAAAADRAFVAGVPGARFVSVDGVDHNYRDRDQWWPAFAAGFRQISGKPPGDAPPP